MRKKIVVISCICLFSAHALSWGDKHQFSYDKGNLKASRGASDFNRENNKDGEVYYSHKNSKISKPDYNKAKGSLPASNTIESSVGLKSDNLVLFGIVRKTHYEQKSQALDNKFDFKLYDKNSKGEISFIHCKGNGKVGPVRAATNCQIHSPKICEQIGLLKHTSDKGGKTKEIGREMSRVYDTLRAKLNSQARSKNHVQPLKDLNTLVQAKASITDRPHEIEKYAQSCDDKKLYPPAKSEKRSWSGASVNGE